MKKYCKPCKLLVKGSSCPVCKGNQFVENAKGRIFVNDAEKSEIAKHLNIKVKGEYAIKL